MKIEILKLGLEDVRDGTALSFDDPRGLCRIGEPTLRALNENPFRQEVGEPALLVGTVDGCAAGMLVFVPGEVFVNGEARRIAWCSGLFVAPEFRHTLLGISIVREARRSYQLVGGSRVADGAFRIFSRLGWIGFPLNRFLMARRSGPVLNHLFGRRDAVRLLRPLLDLVLIFHRGVLEIWQRLLCRGIRLEAVDAMPEELDRALAGLNRPFGCHRSSRWLNWVIANSFCPGPGYKKQLYLVHGRGKQVIAYLVTRVKQQQEEPIGGEPGVSVGSIVDWGVFDTSAVDEGQLWLIAANELTRRGVDVVEICVASTDAAVPFGSLRYGSHRVVLHSASDDPEITPNQISQWTLRQIDGDSGLT